MATSVYVHEIGDARWAAMRRSKIAAAYGSAMEAAAAVNGPTDDPQTASDTAI